MIIKANGKINLSLDITGKRADGYHLLDMIMLPIDLYDLVEVELSDQDHFESNCDLGWDSKNIIYRAVEMMRTAFSLSQHFSIKLEKHIPLQAGLGGGSSDCAAVLKAINELCELNLSFEQLCAIGVKLGADVPFGLYQAPARVKGIGEEIIPLTGLKEKEVLLVKPRRGVNTAEAFRLSDEREIIHPDIDEVERRLLNDEPLDNVLGNSLEESASLLVEEISELKEFCLREGYRQCAMSGSGSTVFVLEDGVNDLDELYAKLRKKADFVVKTKIIV